MNFSNKNNKNGFHLAAIIILSAVVIYYGIIPAFKSVNSDFPNYYTASRMFIEGRDLSRIYDNREFQKVADSYGIEKTIVSYVPQTPPTLLLYAPVAWMNPIHAKWIWTILNLIFLIGSILLLRRIFETSYLPVTLILFSFVIPLANNFALGQAYLFILFMTVLGLYLWKKEKYLAAGLVLGIAGAIKPFVLILLLAAIINKRWKIILGFLCGIALIQLPVLLFSFEFFKPYFSLVLPATISGSIQNPFDSQFGTYTVLFRNLFLFNSFRNPEPLINNPFCYFLLQFLVYATLGIIVAFHETWALETRRASYLQGISILVIISLLIAPINSSYQYILLAIPLICLSKRDNAFIIAAIINFIIFFLLLHFTRLPYLGMFYLVFILIAIVPFREIGKFKIEKKSRSLAEPLFWIAFIFVIWSIQFSSSLWYLLSQTLDKSSPVKSIQTTGFPGELKSIDNNLYFTEIADGNYRVNLNGAPLGIEGYDIFTPSFLAYDRTLMMSCYLMGEGESKLALLAQDGGKWNVLWRRSSPEVINTVLAPWIINPMYGLAFISARNTGEGGEITIEWPLSKHPPKIIKIPEIIYFEWVPERKEFYILNKRLGFGKEGGHEFWVYEIDSLKPEQVKPTELNDYPAIVMSTQLIHDFTVSPDGLFIAYTFVNENMSTDIELRKIVDPTILYKTPYLYQITHPARDYSPAFLAEIDKSGKLHEFLYFISERGGGLNDGRIYRINYDNLK